MSVEQVSGSAWAECPNGVESAAKQAKEDFERENPGNSTKRWDACLYRIEAAEDALRALNSQLDSIRRKRFPRLVGEVVRAYQDRPAAADDEGGQDE